MKIAHLCGPLVRPGGTERSAVELTYQMAKQGVDARIYTPFWKDNLFGDLTKTIEVEEVRLPKLPIFDLYYHLFLIKRLVSIASKWADLLIFYASPAMASYAMRRFSKPCVPFYHIDKWDSNLFGSLRWLAPLYNRPLNALELRNLREAPLVFANSNALASVIRRHEPSANVVPITIGVDTSRFYPQWGKDDGFIMMAGRFHPMNNFELGVSALADTNYKLLIAGLIEKRFLSYYKHIKELVSGNASIRDRVTIETLTEEALIERFQSCSLFLSPRVYDYLGHAALEPMACGKAVVQLVFGSRLDEDPPVIQCDRSPVHWREVVQALMKDPETRINLGRRANEFVQQKHSLKASADQILHYAALLFEKHSKAMAVKELRRAKMS